MPSKVPLRGYSSISLKGHVLDHQKHPAFLQLVRSLTGEKELGAGSVSLRPYLRHATCEAKGVDISEAVLKPRKGSKAARKRDGPGAPIKAVIESDAPARPITPTAFLQTYTRPYTRTGARPRTYTYTATYAIDYTTTYGYEANGKIQDRKGPYA